MRDIGGRFNRLYGETFVLPDILIPSVGARIMGLDDPTAKMSKSTQRPYHAVRLLDGADIIWVSIRRAVTEAGRETRFSTVPANAGVTHLLTTYCCCRLWGTEGVDAAPRIGQDRRCDRLACLSGAACRRCEKAQLRSVYVMRGRTAVLT